MSYPDYPNNRLIVNGTDLTTEFGLILVDGYKLEPPKPKTYIVDIPGGNGKLDLTDSLLGDVAFDNRHQEFNFYVIDAQNFEATKTAVSDFLHGRAFDYVITMDPDYTYHGRFAVTGYEHKSSSMGIMGQIKVSIDSDPYKWRYGVERHVNGIGGQVYSFPCGRRPVRPTIITENFVTVEFDGQTVQLPVGTWTINDLIFKYGSENKVYFNTYPVKSTTWYDLKTVRATTWGQFKERPLSEWYKINGLGNIMYKAWNEIPNTTWGNLASSRWGDLCYIVDMSYSVEDVIVKYDWGDL